MVLDPQSLPHPHPAAHGAVPASCLRPLPTPVPGVPPSVHTHAHSHSHAHIRVLTHAHSPSHLHTCMPPHTDSHTHTHTHMHSHSHPWFGRGRSARRASAPCGQHLPAGRVFLDPLQARPPPNFPPNLCLQDPRMGSRALQRPGGRVFPTVSWC